MARSGVSSQRSTRGRPCAASRARNPLSERALMQDGTHTFLPAREPSIDLSEPDQLVRTVTASLEGRWPSPSFWIPPGRFDCYLRRRSSSECERAHRTASHARIHARAVVAAGSDRPHVRAGQTGDERGAWDTRRMLCFAGLAGSAARSSKEASAYIPALWPLARWTAPRCRRNSIGASGRLIHSAAVPSPAPRVCLLLGNRRECLALCWAICAGRATPMPLRVPQRLPQERSHEPTLRCAPQRTGWVWVWGIMRRSSALL
jgi:hypothetical protein